MSAYTSKKQSITGGSQSRNSSREPEVDTTEEQCLLAHSLTGSGSGVFNLAQTHLPWGGASSRDGPTL